MGTGASKNQRSAVVSSCQQPTRLLNHRAQNRRASRRESEEPEYVLLPGIKNEKFYSNLHTPLNLELLGDVPTASSAAPGLNSNAILDGIPAKDRAGIDTSSSESTSSISSTKSVTEELDALQTELDQVLVGHYFANNKPAGGVLRTAEIASLERHNQLQPLPQDYKPVIRDTTEDGHSDSDWVRPVDLVRQERDLADRKLKREERSFEQDTKEEEKKEETQSSVIVFDMEDDQVSLLFLTFPLSFSLFFVLAL